VSHSFLLKRLSSFVALTVLAVPSFAIQPAEGPDPSSLFGRAFTSPELDVQPSAEIYALGAETPSLRALDSFFAHHGHEWEVRWDRRSDRANVIQGAGVPMLPGRGNTLTRADLPVRQTGTLQTADVETLVRGFMQSFPELFTVEGSEFRLRPEGSGNFGRDRQLWTIELQQFHGGVPVEGANAYFRINNGNLVQFGTEKVAPVRAGTKPRLDQAAALAAALKSGGFKVSEISEILEPGRLELLPVLTAGEQPGVMFAGKPGTGYQHRLVWEVSFRMQGDPATWRARVNARDGRVLELADLNAYSTVNGGIYPETNSDAEVVRGFPFNNVTNGTTKVTDANGVYTYGSGTATSTLNGKYIKISDACGAISLSNSTTGDLAFGTSGGTDCTTPGVGGAGNTHAARSGFYHLTNINRKAAGFLPTNTWLSGLLTANMNINQTCNAFWNGTTVNFYRSGGGCSNTGEIAAVFLHEWGHGMDTKSGGAASGDQASGEAVGDTFAFLETKTPCIGKNFRPGVNCYNCTACTGVRDVQEFSTLGTKPIAKPANVTNNSGINCDRYACPYTGYRGPMGYEGHCESYIASSANWDLAQQLITRYGTTAGWAAMDSVWYKSLTPSKSAYRVVSGGTCNAAAVVDGCGSSNWYTVFLPADDDDGNLANGTPNACRIWDAFNAHGIACGTRPTCTA